MYLKRLFFYLPIVWDWCTQQSRPSHRIGTIYRMKIHVKNRFWVIPNHILCDARLSWKAKWLWVYIQSKPDDWDFSSDRMSREAPDGRDSTRSGLRELERFWFLTRTRWHGAGGHWDYEWELNEVWNTLNTPTPIKRDTENTATDEPTTGNPSTENTAIKKERITKKELQKNTDTLACFDIFWNEYPNKVGKPNAMKKYREKEHTDIIYGLTLWKTYWVRSNTEQRYIPHPATWLNQERWKDIPPETATNTIIV